MADSEFNDFPEVQKAIKENSGGVSEALGRWQSEAKLIAKEHPELAYELSRIGEYGSVTQIKTAWKELAKKIPNDSNLARYQTQILNGLLIAREMEHVRYNDPEAIASAPMPSSNVPKGVGGAAAAALAAPLALIKPKHRFMEEDDGYLTKKEELKTKWYDEQAEIADKWEREHGRPVENDGRFQGNKEDYETALENFRREKDEELQRHLHEKGFSREQELDFLFGSLDDPTKPTLDTRTRAEFTKELEERSFLNYKRRKLKRYNKNQENLESYNNGKYQKNPSKDPHVAQLKQQTANHQEAREMAVYFRYLREHPKEDISFEDFLMDPKYGNWQKEIMQLRQRVANAEWQRWQYSKINPGQKISENKIQAYANDLQLYVNSFVETETMMQHRYPLSFLQYIPIVRNIIARQPGMSIMQPPMQQEGQHEGEGSNADQGGKNDQQQENQQPGRQRSNQKRNNPITNLIKNRINQALNKLRNEALKKIGLWILQSVIWPILDGLGALFGSSIFWVVIIIAAVVVLIFILLLLNILGGAPPPIQLTCGSSDLNAVYGTTDNVYHNFLEKNYAIDGDDTAYPSNSKTDKDLKKSMAVAIYSTICIAFGDVETPGQTQGSGGTGKIALNHFGIFTVGNCNQRGCNQDGTTITGSAGSGYRSCDAQHSCQVMYQLWPGPNPFIKGDLGSTCTVSALNPQPKGNLILWALYNADKCLQSDGKGHTVASPRLQFLLAQSMAYTLLIQQQVLHGPDLTKDADFVNALIVKGKWNPLPTKACMSHFDPNNPTNPITDLMHIGRDCFADMVGEYLVYPYYVNN